MNDLDKQRNKNSVKKELGDANWELRSFESKEDMDVMIYLYDHFDTGELIMAGLRHKDVKGLSGVSHSMDDITSSLDSAFKSYLAEPSKQEKSKWTEILGSMLGLYMLKTKTYAKLNKIKCADDDTKQFIVLRYPNSQSNVSTLRPFSLVSKSRILSPDEIKKLALGVIERDEQVNAGFFNFNEVSKLRK